MGRFAFISLVAVLLFVFVGSSAGADERSLPNIIYNGSFEKLTYDPAFAGEDLVAVAAGKAKQHPFFWRWRDGMEMVLGESHSGDVSLLVAGPAEGYTTNSMGYYVYNRGSGTYLRPGEKYVLTAWVKAEGVSKQGVRFSFQGSPTVYTGWVNGTTDWRKVEFELEAPSDKKAPGGHVRIHWDLNEGGKVWIDDVSLVPVSGKVDKAPAPTITPEGGTFVGRKYVKIGTDLPGAVIHYTVDGQEPDRFDVEYVGPFLVDGPTVVKAKVFQSAYESATSEARFDIKAEVGEGVPFYPTGWGMDVEEWWAGHIYNPDSPNHFEGPIVSPDSRVDVSEVLRKHPDSKTGGIVEAIAELPEEGGVLWFPKDGGPYVVSQGFTITGRSNLHFLSEGAEVCFKRGQMRFYSDHAVDWKLFVLNPVKNFYFKDIHFTGANVNEQAIYFRHCVDILFDDCLFTDFGTGQRGKIISANVNTDNIWYRNCDFKDNSAGFPTYWDGVHNAGCLNCRFSGDYGGGDFLIFTNNDMSPFCAYERTAQYVVFDSCRFIGEPGRKGRSAIAATPANMLVVDNYAKGPFDCFVLWNGRGKSNTQPRLQFSGSGLKVVNNSIEDVEEIVQFQSDVAQYHRKEQFTMVNEVRGNKVKNIKRLFSWMQAKDPHHPPYERFENVTFRDNEIVCDRLPVVKLLADSENMITRITVGDREVDVKVIDPDVMERIENVRVYDNDIHIKDPMMVIDRYGERIDHKEISVEDNNFDIDER
jgi:hypothetical protein